MRELRGKIIKGSQILNIHFCNKSVEKEVGESWPNLQTFRESKNRKVWHLAIQKQVINSGFHSKNVIKGSNMTIYNVK